MWKQRHAWITSRDRRLYGIMALSYRSYYFDASGNRIQSYFDAWTCSVYWIEEADFPVRVQNRDWEHWRVLTVHDYSITFHWLYLTLITGSYVKLICNTSLYTTMVMGLQVMFGLWLGLLSVSIRLSWQTLAAFDKNKYVSNPLSIIIIINTL